MFEISIHNIVYRFCIIVKQSMCKYERNLRLFACGRLTAPWRIRIGGEHSLLVTEDIPPTLHHCNLAMFIPGTFVSFHLAPSVVKHIHPSVRLAEIFTLLGNPIPKYLAEFVILILSPIVNA